MADTFLARHRGTITGIAASGPRIIYVTRHPEGYPTTLNVFDFEAKKVGQTKLPSSSSALLLHEKTAYIAGSDGTVYTALPGQSAEPFAQADDVTSLVAVRDGVAAAAGHDVIVWDNDGRAIAKWDVDEPVSALAASPDGSWLTAGTRRGKLVVFRHDDEQQAWVREQAERLHDGEVTALAFAPDELRVYSCGTDGRILISYVRGSFDTEDRGGSNSHDGPVRALLQGPQFATDSGVNPRFFTLGDDSTIKSWPRARTGSQRPSTQADGVVQGRHLALVTIDEEPHLVMAGNDATLRLFSFGPEGRIEAHVGTVHDLYSRARHLAGNTEPETRRSAYDSLAVSADAHGVALLTERLRDYEEDHKLSVYGVRLLAGIDHQDVAAALQEFFSADASDVRVAAFDGLIGQPGVDVRKTLDTALAAGFVDLGLRAVSAAAERPEEGVEVLQSALANQHRQVRNAALSALEEQFGDDPQGTLLGLDSPNEETRRLALVRLYRRGLLDHPRVAAQIRRTFDDGEYRVRQMAFHISTLRSPNLSKALRRDDPDYHRHIFEIEEFGKPESERRTEVPPRPVLSFSRLGEDDLQPLLEATASRSVDIATLGARELAVLGDERALGTLLQLSREPTAAARANAAIALEVLSDPRSLRRVRRMLHDPEQTVRERAFSALQKLQSDEPFATVSAGLSASATDTRQRALGLLAKTLKASNDKLSGDFGGRDLLLRALNDADASIRLEAFKNTLNLGVDGGADTLRFIRQSHHTDVRAQTLEEAKAHAKDDEYKRYLLELFDDSDRTIWLDALDFALDRWPSTEHERIWRAALGAKTPEARIHAIERLGRVREEELRLLLSGPLEDDKPAVRLAAVRSLVAADMREVLSGALDASHSDVRIEAAAALASLGDERALDGLLDIVDDYTLAATEGAPDARLEEIRPRVVSALRGIGELGHSRAISQVIGLIEAASDTAVLNAAATTLPWLTRPQSLDEVRPLVQHAHASIATQAALALAYQGDASVESLIFGKLGPADEFAAAFALRDSAPDRFLDFADRGGITGDHALSVILLMELSEHDGVPERCVTLLSANDPNVRLRAGEAIEKFGDRASFYAWTYRAVNELAKTGEKHTVPEKTLLALSRALVQGAPLVAVRAAQLVGLLQRGDGEAFDSGWAIFSDRLSDELERLDRRENAPVETDGAGEAGESGLVSAWSKLKSRARELVSGSADFDEALANLAFGAYVGLTRETGTHSSHLVRAAAISGLKRLAGASERYANDVGKILLVGLGDPAQNVRERAFDALLELGVDHDTISTEALSTGFDDMGFRGLDLLADSGGGTDLLERTLLESTNGLEEQAAKLLVERSSELAVHKLGVAAASETLRRRSITGLARHYSNDDGAAKAMRAALESRHRDVRYHAAIELAARADSAAFQTLASFVDTDDYSEQNGVARAFEQLGDPAAIDVLFDQIEAKPDSGANSVYLQAVIKLGDPDSTGRLLEWIDRDILRQAASNVALQISGYKQYEWMDEADITDEWEESLDPRYPAYFADLLSLAYRIADAGVLGTLVGFAKWPEPNEEIDETLSALLSFSDENVRHRAVEVAGWRAVHRDGPHAGLVEVLGAGDPLDQFYAAEGLALAGRAEGLPVLQTAVDAIDDWGLRERAVLALGRLAEPSTVDMLIELASDDQNYLQTAAAEAIGYMSRTDRADEIFAILKRLATAETGARSAAFKGLRWFDTPAAWDVLRRQAQHENWWVAQEAVDLLRHDAGSRPVLVELLLETDDWDIAESAASGLRHLDGPESLEPDYLIVQAKMSGFDASEDTLERLRERGDVGRILEILPRIDEGNRDIYYEPIVGALLSRDPLPVGKAAPLLASENGSTASVAARIVGRAGTSAADHSAGLVEATRKARSDWASAHKEAIANRRGAAERLDDVSTRYRWLLWACGQLETGADEIAAAVELPSHPTANVIREIAFGYLGEGWFGELGVRLLVDKTKNGDTRTRELAAAELERAAPERAAALLGGAASDDVVVGRLARSADPDDAKPALRKAAVDPATAGIALPQLAALRDTEGLVAAMQDAALDDRVRRGAIDALSTIETDEVVELLATFGADEDQDEVLRKAAWRARRRLTRR